MSGKSQGILRWMISGNPVNEQSEKFFFRMKTSILQRKDFSQLLKNVGGNLSSLKQELTDYNTFTVAVADKDIKPQHFR